MKKLPFILLLIAQSLFGQGNTYTLDDTLRGSITPQRIWWDLNYYELNLRVDPENESIAGFNTIHYTVLEPSQSLQIDLQPPLKIDRIEQDGQVLKYQNKGASLFSSNFKNCKKKAAGNRLLFITRVSHGKPNAHPGTAGFPGRKTAPASRLSLLLVRGSAPVSGGPAKTTCTMNPIP